MSYLITPASGATNNNANSAIVRRLSSGKIQAVPFRWNDARRGESRPASSDLISVAVKQPTGWATDGNRSCSQLRLDRTPPARLKLHHFPNRLSGADSAAQRAGWEDLLRTWLAKGDRRITVKTPPNGGVSIIGRTRPRGEPLADVRCRTQKDCTLGFDPRWREISEGQGCHRSPASIFATGRLTIVNS